MPVMLPNPEKLHLVAKDSVGKEIPASGGDPKYLHLITVVHTMLKFMPDQKRFQKFKLM